MTISKKFNAKVDELSNVQNFVLDFLNNDLDSKSKNQILIVIEEIFINIASYAYEEKGDVEVVVSKADKTVEITFVDSGMKFDPLAKEDPNVNAKAQERRIGGLGIFMVKNLMDDVNYKYEDNKNILTLVKKY